MRQRNYLIDLNLYDFHARNYDPAIGRWLSVDPLAEQFPDWSPYRYGFNNPIMFTDPTGLFETKFGAWWHKQWNGNDSSSDIRFDDKRKEYFYTNHSSYVDDDGNEGLSIDFIYKSQKGDGGRLVFEAGSGASVGLQVGVKTGWGRIEGGVITTEIGKVGWSTEEDNNSGFYADWGDGKGHNFIGAGLGFDKTKLSIGGGVDYVTPDMIPPGGDIIDYYSNNGKAVWSGNMGPKTNLWNAKKGSTLNEMGTAVRTRARANTNNDYTTDISVGVKAIIGIDLRVKFGITGKKN